eukprot:5027102-Pyramimonas_sp.AAC.1
MLDTRGLVRWSPLPKELVTPFFARKTGRKGAPHRRCEARRPALQGPPRAPASLLPRVSHDWRWRRGWTCAGPRLM